MARTGQLTRQHSQGRMPRNHKVNANPLRLVVRTGVGEFGNHEELECGHLIVPPRDFIGETVATRRRCWRCGAAAPPVEPPAP